MLSDPVFAFYVVLQGSFYEVVLDEHCWDLTVDWALVEEVFVTRKDG